MRGHLLPSASSAAILAEIGRAAGVVEPQAADVMSLAPASALNVALQDVQGATPLTPVGGEGLRVLALSLTENEV